jgi:putative F0F1-ATPase subunit (Ca2+/Mg2+ transporter)
MAENPHQSPKANPDTQTNQQKAGKQRLTNMKALGIATEFGFIIIIPLLAFGYLGKWLDHRYHQNFFILLGILLAIVTSGLWFFRVIKSLMKDMDIK